MAEEGSGCGEHGGGVAEESDVAKGEILTVVTVGMAVAISFFLSLVERRVVRFKYSTRVLKMLYRELTIVGLVSFVLYVAEKAGRNLGSNQELFEEIHMTMFTLALLYAGMCLMLVGLALRGSGRARIEKLSVAQWYRHWTGAHAWQQAGAGAVGDSRVVHKPVAPSCCSRTLWWCGFGAASRQAAIARYHELRCLFVLVHELPDSFVLLYYLKKCEQQVFFVLSEIRGRLWAVFAWFIIADIALRDTLPDYELNSMAGAVLLCFVAMIAVCIVLHHKAITMLSQVLQTKDVALNAAVCARCAQSGTSWAELLAKHRALNLYAPKQRLMREREVASLFWFGAAPEYMILALQGVIFVAAFTAAFSLRVIGQSTTGMGTAVLMWIVALTSFGVVGLLLHRVVPLYALIKYVGTDVDRKLVKAALNKQARREAAQRRGAANDSGVRTARGGLSFCGNFGARCREIGASILPSATFRVMVSSCTVLDMFLVAVLTHPPASVSTRELVFAVDCVCLAIFVLEIFFIVLATSPLCTPDRSGALRVAHMLLVAVMVLLAFWRSDAVAPEDQANATLRVLLRLTRILHGARVLVTPPTLEDPEDEEDEDGGGEHRPHHVVNKSSRDKPKPSPRRRPGAAAGAGAGASSGSMRGIVAVGSNGVGRRPAPSPSRSRAARRAGGGGGGGRETRNPLVPEEGKPQKGLAPEPPARHAASSVAVEV